MGNNDSNKHWIAFQENLLDGEDEKFYLTVTIDMKNNTIKVLSNGKSIGENVCNENYLDKETICNNEIPFTVGVIVSGNGPEVTYCSFKLYGCRLYDRVLSDEEIKQNYEQSKGLLND